MFSLPVTVDAGIVYSGVQNLTIGLPVGQRPASGTVVSSNGTGFGLDVDGDLAPDFAFVVGQGLRAGPSTERIGNAVGLGATGASFLINGAGLFPYPVVTALPAGFDVGTLASTWSSIGFLRFVGQTTTRYETGLAAGKPAFLGMRFERSGNTHFGWLRLMVEDGPQGFPVSVTLMDWAWNDQPLESIQVGQVPEANPALAMLAAAGTGLAAWRLGRSKKETGNQG